MFCVNCGAQVNKDAKFCEYCGVKLSEKIITEEKKSLSQPAVRTYYEHNTTSSSAKPGLGLGIASLVIGITIVFFSILPFPVFIFGILAIILGAVGLYTGIKERRNEGANSLVTIIVSGLGIGVSIITTFISLILFLIFGISFYL